MLWGRYDLLAAMPPFITGGSMIELVRMEGSTYAAPPSASRPACPWLPRPSAWPLRSTTWAPWVWPGSPRTSRRSTQALLAGLAQRPWARVVGPVDVHDRSGAVSFVVEGVHAHDVGQILDDAGIAVRVGHHCAWPLHRRFRLTATTRASFAAYNTLDEVAALLAALDRVPAIFGVTV